MPVSQPHGNALTSSHKCGCRALGREPLLFSWSRICFRGKKAWRYLEQRRQDLIVSVVSDRDELILQFSVTGHSCVRAVLSTMPQSDADTSRAAFGMPIRSNA